MVKTWDVKIAQNTMKGITMNNINVDMLIKENERLRNTIAEYEKQKTAMTEAYLKLTEGISQDEKDQVFINTCAINVVQSIILSKKFDLDDNIERISYVIAARMLEESKRRNSQGWLKNENN